MRIMSKSKIVGNEIIQIIPATTGVLAIFKTPTGEESYPVVCWALEHDIDGDDIYQHIVGMTVVAGFQTLVRVYEEGNTFDRYEYGKEDDGISSAND